MDGVLRTYPSSHSAEVENELGLELGSLLPIAFQEKLVEPAITGKITDEEWRAQIVDELAQRYERTKVKAAIAHWTEFPGKLDEEVYRAYCRVKLNKGYKIALLTNATTKLNSDLRALGVFDLFDIVYNTCEIGFAKPDPRAFSHVLSSIGYPPEEVLFIDDREENTQVAQSLGFEVHHFKSYQGLQKILEP